MLWLGSMHRKKDIILDLQMSGKPVYALGVHFTYDLEVSEKKYCFDKLGSLKKTPTKIKKTTLSSKKQLVA